MKTIRDRGMNKHLQMQRIEAGDIELCRIIHLPTGCTLFSSTKRVAKRVMRELSELDWNYDDPTARPADTTTRSDAIIRAARMENRARR
jgi:hypothetical protein